MQSVYSRDGKNVAIKGDYSPWTVYVTVEGAEFLGGNDAAFHEIKRLQGHNLLPRMGSASLPLTVRDLQMGADNEQRRLAGGPNKYWQFASFVGVREYTGYDTVMGYGYVNDAGDFCMVDRAGNVLFALPKEVRPQQEVG